MKAALWHSKRDVRIEEIPEPVIQKNKVKIKVAWCGICGTDLHEYTAGPIFIPGEEPHPLTGQKAPVVLGHEFSGEVVEVADDVTNVKVGDRVCVEPIIPCRTCAPCRAGKYNLCEIIAFHGSSSPGGGAFSEITMVDSSMVYKMPAEMTYEQGAFVEPAAMTVHAVRQSNLKLGDKVAVFGAGPIGLLTVQMVKAAGASEVIVVELSEERREFARKTGATHVLDPRACDVVQEIRRLTSGGVNVAFEATGVPVVLNQAIESTVFDGQIVIISIWEGSAAIFPNQIVLQEKQIKGILGNRNTFPATIELIRQGMVKVDSLITRKITLDELVDKGFEALVHEKNHVKILVRP
jgi:(R,R)-butanediol dehydrogenase/meso-butanediol dehydrogenase/diacetyl reductase